MTVRVKKCFVPERWGLRAWGRDRHPRCPRVARQAGALCCISSQGTGSLSDVPPHSCLNTLAHKNTNQGHPLHIMIRLRSNQLVFCSNVFIWKVYKSLICLFDICTCLYYNHDHFKIYAKLEIVVTVFLFQGQTKTMTFIIIVCTFKTYSQMHINMLVFSIRKHVTGR